MARSESAMLALGTSAPDFVLTDVVTGHQVSTQAVSGPEGMLVMFICRHCPFVKHLERALAQLGRDYETSGVGLVAISSNDAAKLSRRCPQKSGGAGQRIGIHLSLPL